MIQWYNENLTSIEAVLVMLPLALSFQVSLSSGLFSLIGVGFFGLGGYATAILSLHGQSIWIAAAAPMVASIPGGLLVGFLLLRLRGLYLAMATVAFDLIVGVIATQGGKLTGGAAGLFGIPLIIPVQALAIAAVLMILVVSQLERGAIGRGFASIRLNDQFASSLGISVERRRMTMFVFSVLLGTVSGVFYVLVLGTIDPTTASFQLIVSALTMVVLGGMASWRGAIIGVILVAWAPQYLGFSGAYQTVLYGGILVLVTMYCPQGIFGLLQQGYRALRTRAWRRPGQDDPVSYTGSGTDSAAVSATRTLP
jgi:branched-chain amino acid transport system permease protein